jgi:hypothetical protein
MNRATTSTLFLLALSLLSGLTSAHSGDTSYLTIDTRADSGELTANWGIAMADLQWALDLDSDGDAKTSRGEIDARRDAISRLVEKNLSVRRGAMPCPFKVMDMRPSSRDAQPYLELQLRGRCDTSGPLQVQTGLFFGSAAYTALLDVLTNRGATRTLLSESQPGWLEPATPSLGATLLRFLGQGTWHVLIGYDHIAFLLLLLLPSVLRATQQGWTQVTRVRDVLRDILKIVTAFTIAHSITLGLAATNTLRLPTQPIEAAIAASIVVAGLMNLFPRTAGARLAVAFGFGLVHGFGFANALQEIGAQGFALAPMLAGFNLGVEVAQILVVCLSLPILMLLSRRPSYARRVMPACSLAIAVTGAFWLASRLT